MSSPTSAPTPAPAGDATKGGGAGGPQQHFASLYVGDLNPEVTEAVLFEVFNPVGPVASIRICRDSVSRRSLGYAYVNFHNVADAERALDTLNYSSIKGRACRIMWSHRDPSMRKAGNGNIFVKNLDKAIDNKALYDTFSLFGNILSCKVATDGRGESKGYGFVHYESPEAAQQSIEKVNGMEIGTKTVTVSMFLKQNEREGGNARFSNIYVKNIPKAWTEERLLELFTPHGTITSSVLMADAKQRPYAFVNYEDPDAAAKAVEECNGKDMREFLEEAEKKEPKEGEEGPHADEKLFVGRAQTKAEREDDLRKERNTQMGVNLYIKNLDESIDDEKLKELFDPFGDVKSTRVIVDEAGVSKGFGFVSYATPSEATKAVTEMHLKSVNSKPLYVGLAERRKDRQDRLESRYRGPGMGGMGGMGGGGMMGMGGMGGGMMGKGMKGGGMGGYGKGGMQQMRPPMGGNNMMGPMYSMQQMQQMQMQMQQMQMRPGMMQQGKGMNMMPQAANMMGGKGMMRPMGMRPMQPMPQQQAPTGPTGDLTAATLANAPPGMQKQMLGEKLYAAIARTAPDMAGKITGMMLEMDNSELLILLESPEQLSAKVNEARTVLGGR